jgi:hypothetical protein
MSHMLTLAGPRRDEDIIIAWNPQRSSGHHPAKVRRLSTFGVSAASPTRAVVDVNSRPFDEGAIVVAPRLPPRTSSPEVRVDCLVAGARIGGRRERRQFQRLAPLV